MRTLLIVSDAWAPQTNGVVTTLQAVIGHLERSGYRVQVFHPGLFATLPLPGYPEIRVVRNPWKLASMIRALRPDAIHIATEGPLGLCARLLLCRWRMPFSTSLHTKFPEYLQQRTGLPVGFGYRLLRWFHRPALQTLCTTESHRRELAAYGFSNLVVWGRGVDTGRFRPLPGPRAARARPRLLYVGRVAVEKNLEAFLDLAIDADKRVVGDGPARAELQRAYPDAEWLGYRHGAALVREFAEADAFVFPSRTDTFGLVMLEAMACGTPVAAYPVTGPRDVVVEGRNGALDTDLLRAVRRALQVSRAQCRADAETRGWDRIAQRMAAGFHWIDWNRPERVTARAGARRAQPGRSAA